MVQDGDDVDQILRQIVDQLHWQAPDGGRIEEIRLDRKAALALLLGVGEMRKKHNEMLVAARQVNSYVKQLRAKIKMVQQQ
jgi:hypothetical protein